MADDVDSANLLMENQIQRALELRKVMSQKNTIRTKNCMECGEDIPAARQEFGFKFCVACAAEAERRKALFVDD